MKPLQKHPDFKAIPVLRGLLEIGPNTLRAQAVASEMLQSLVQGLSIHNNWNDDAEFRSFLVLASATLGLTQKELAYRLMVSQMTLQRWIKGDGLPLPNARKGIVASLTEMAYLIIDEIAKNDDVAESKSQSSGLAQDDANVLPVDGLCEVGCTNLPEEAV